ncbi:unnamed protein product [Vitrella brassicaformis CCMP3155]|uniref:Uncharacterized protein n=1 Tax=Vitrella brassicaformis (strain CCMP3155) TaxID=1169540 RepID=A0A0G4G9X4_VITBC|nr:unnamed protein product [Vitrella brassicaformis CCMP3155]|mmetsp:Transcript_47885/g.119809  ORF Transcript_47885/g.119809 Transcript_47885/m.119809 type:complete len:134 (+) Transcript_47885:757-1158(+)|eukprot:CEM25575.1 unnamed protein product [Vitrella brassicaformis CCMP3155]
MAWGERVAFAMIYIKEAHAADVWPIGDHLTIERPNEPKNNEDRIKNARDFLDVFGNFTWPVYIDTVANEFEKEFAPWPFRFYIIDSSMKVLWKAQPVADECTYDTTDNPNGVEGKIKELLAAHTDTQQGQATS